MRSKSGAITVLFVLFFLFPFGNQTCIAQEQKQPFLEIILQLQELFDVRFSYSGNEIVTLMVQKPEYTNTLPEILNQLTKDTGLEFKNISERYIAITSSDSEAIFINICGMVIQAETLFPLEGATIQVLGSTQATISNREGLFSVENIQQNATIRVSYVGFETLIISVAALQSISPCATLVLKPQISELQDVVLESIFSRGINKTKDGTITLQVETFGNLPGLTEPDVLLMVQALPGISSVDETVSNINIRGGTTDENLILWDDIRMYQNGHFFGLISAFNPYLTKKVTVFKNGTNARYGESVSGVIAMQSASGLPEKTSGGIQLNMINVGAFGEIAVNDKLGIYVSGRRSINDFVKSPTYTRFFNRMFQNTEITNLENITASGTLNAEEDFSFYDLSLKAIYKHTDKDIFQINFLNIDNDLNFTETFSNAITENSETSELDQNSIAGGVTWKRNWRENLSTNALVYGTYYLLNASNLDIFSNQQIIQNNEVLETGAKLDANLTWINNNTFSAGYQFTETGVSNTQDVNLPRFRSFIKEVLRNHSIFISNVFNFPYTRTSITAGLRGNYFPKFERFLAEPRINIHQKLGNGFAVEAAAELKSQSVTQRIDLQSDFLGVEKRRWVVANEQNVPLVTSTQYSLSFLYQKNNWLLQVEGFRKYVDGITTANQAFQNQLEFVRTIGSYESQGLEFILNKKTNAWSSWFSYSYTTVDYTFESVDPSTFPHNADIRHQVVLATSYSVADFNMSAGINWHSGKPYTIPLTDNAIQLVNGVPTIQYQTPNQERLDDYFRIDISAGYDFNISSKVSGKVNAAILNVSNQKNILNTNFVIETNAEGISVINQVEQVSLAFTPNASLQILF